MSAKTKREIWMELLKGQERRSINDFLQSDEWKNGFASMLAAPWGVGNGENNDPMEELRAIVERHLLRGKRTGPDALMAALNEKPQLYEAAMAGVRSGTGSTSSSSSGSGSVFRTRSRDK